MHNAGRPWRTGGAKGRVGCLRVVVEVELVGVGAQPHLVHLLGPLVIEPRFQEVAGEHAALQEEFVVLLQGVQDLVQAAGYLLDARRLLGRELVDVSLQRLARVD